MTQHSIKELERQYDAATSKRVAAQKAEKAAYERLLKALSEQKNADAKAVGVNIGDQIKFAGRHAVFCGFEGLSRRACVARVRVIKKDGSLSRDIQYSDIYHVAALVEAKI